MIPAIEIKNLHKNYANTQALAGVDLEIPHGQFFGLLGPNGAGKTTLIQTIVGLVHPSAGKVRIFGAAVDETPLQTKQAIGFSPQEVNVDRFFNVRRTLEFQGGYHGLSPKAAKQLAITLLKQFGLEEKSSQQFYKLSGGMQKRLLIARALMCNPKILILDEPTAGVDVEQRHELWSYLRLLKKRGTTILLTTHYIDEAEELCERIGVINHGKIIELGSPRELMDRYCEPEVKISVEGVITPEEFLDLPQIQVEQNIITAKTKAIGGMVELILSKLLSRPGRRVSDINVKKGNLEEVFIRLTGTSIQQEASE